MIEPVESRVLTEKDAMDSIVLSTCDACCTIQLLCHMLFPLHFPLQLPAYEPSSLLDQGNMADQASGGLLFHRREYLQVVVYQVTFHRVIAIDSSIFGEIVDSEPRVSSRRMISICR